MGIIPLKPVPNWWDVTDSQGYVIPASFRSGIDVSPHFGKVIAIYADTGKALHGFVLPGDSIAKTEGDDIIYKVCSKKCAQLFREALKPEIDNYSREYN